jgi:hypothetical protein
MRQLVTLTALGLSLAVTTSSWASHSIASFFTPAKAAYCKWHVPLDYRVSTRTVLECWTPNDGFTVWMTPNGRPRKEYDKDNKWRYARSLRRLTFRQDWWGSDVGLAAEEYGNPYTHFREGTGSPRGALHFRCKSRASGLTCRNRAGHGFWLGRFRGYRIF